MRLLVYVCEVAAKLATTICPVIVALNSTFRFIPFISTISYKSIMSNESSFDGQTFYEFDDLLPKQLSTDSDNDHVDPEHTGATTSSQAPLTSVPTLSQTSMVPSTPGISESFSLEIAPVQSTDCSQTRKRMGRPHKRIYARRLTVGISNTREDASAKLQDSTPKMSKPTSHKFLKTHPPRGYTSKFHVPPRIQHGWQTFYRV